MSLFFKEHFNVTLTANIVLSSSHVCLSSSSLSGVLTWFCLYEQFCRRVAEYLPIFFKKAFRRDSDYMDGYLSSHMPLFSTSVLWWHRHAVGRNTDFLKFWLRSRLQNPERKNPCASNTSTCCSSKLSKASRSARSEKLAKIFRTEFSTLHAPTHRLCVQLCVFV